MELKTKDLTLLFGFIGALIFNGPHVKAISLFHIAYN